MVTFCDDLLGVFEGDFEVGFFGRVVGLGTSGAGVARWVFETAYDVFAFIPIIWALFGGVRRRAFSFGHDFDVVEFVGEEAGFGSQG